jgi:DNA-binding MarR family transcriptional regulator
MTAEAPGRPATRQVSAEMVRLMRQLGRLKAQAGNRHGLEWSSYVLLFHLVSEGPMRSSVLAERVAADPSTVSRQAATLVELGLVERRPDPADRRAVQLAATDHGTQLFRRVRENRDAILEAVLCDWSDADVEQLTELLARFTTDLERHRPLLPRNPTSMETR